MDEWSLFETLFNETPHKKDMVDGQMEERENNRSPRQEFIGFNFFNDND